MDQHATEIVTKVTGIVFVVTSMLSAGMNVSFGEVATQVKRVGLVALALAASFIAAPLIAWGLCKVIPISEDYAIGLMLVSGAAGPPLLPKLAEKSKANVPFAITLMLLLVVGTVVFLPLVMPRVIEGLSANPVKIALPLVVLIMLPLAIGMIVRRVSERAAKRAEPALRHCSDLFLILFVVMMLATHLHALWGAVGSGAILAAMLFVLITGAFTHGVCRADVPTRRVMVIGTAQRNIAAALVTAASSFPGRPDVVVMVVVIDVVAVIMLLAAVHFFRRANAKGAGAA